MLFVTSLLIFSFCFVFYIIWNQFLRKDTRLSIGLKILQKKMDVLENFSEKSDVQLRKGVELLDKKNRELEKIVNEARFCIFKMEKLITGIENKNENTFKKPSKTKISLVKDSQTGKEKKHFKPHALQMKKEKLVSIKAEKEEQSDLSISKKFDFGESPFSNLNFVDSDPKKKKQPPYDPSPSV